jgi:demethylmenaquinone methyltransferase/2-methoxy-6-polyprenyl-1,4-benzoquinol methylase
MTKEEKLETDAGKYYAQRAEEYERIYQKSERQKDIKIIKNFLTGVFKGHDVLDIACGTGYWTQYISTRANSILGVDCNSEVLEIAKRKDYARCNTRFLEDDAFVLKNVTKNFTAGFCGFWWSHIPKNRLHEFIRVFHSKLSNQAIVVLLDNRYVHGSSTPISQFDEDGNSYQVRVLDCGRKYEILKNFPSREELITDLRDYSTDAEYIALEYYWIMKYTVKK